MPPPVARRDSIRSGRRASEPFLTDQNLPLFEQVSQKLKKRELNFFKINPTQMINEAEIDESHEWSSIRHPSVPRAPAPPQRPPARPQRGRLVSPGVAAKIEYP